MPQKNAKKAKVEKSKAPVKPGKAGKSAKPEGMGSTLKKLAKTVVAKVSPSLGKKVLPEAKKVVAAKVEKPAAKKPLPALPVKKPLVVAKKKPEPAPIEKEKEKKIIVKPALPAVKPEKNGKKKAEVVLEVPAPKGVALLGRDGKKKGKSASESAGGKKRCREPGCDHESLLNGYCRLHYIKNWRKIKRKESILASGQLNNYVEELVNKYPDKYLDVIRQDLASEKEWGKVVVDLELDATDEEASSEEDLDAVPEGVRPAVRGGEFDDDSESF